MSTSKLVALALAALLPAAPASAHFKVLYSFCDDCGEGTSPNSLIGDPRGNLFGTTDSGGIKNCGDETPSGCGTVFELKRKKGGGYDYSVLYKFQDGSDGAFPSGPLVIDTAGNLYGTTRESEGGDGWGNVFELVRQNGAWTLKILYTFCPNGNYCPDGALSEAGLTYPGQQSENLYDGTSPLFGTASFGGQANNDGVVFEIQPQNGNWNYAVIYDFCSQANCADGGGPEAPLLEDASGNLYGTTVQYGGNVFELAPVNGGWSETVLHVFCSEANCSDGWGPGNDGLALDSAGTLYGLTVDGGREPCSIYQYGCGVAYKLTSNGNAWQETVLHTFCGPKNCSDGAQPKNTPVLDASGNAFGTTVLGGGANGTLFELSGSKFQALHRFCTKTGCLDGENPTGNLVLGAGGAIFGTTYAGGANHGGTVWMVTP